MDRHHTILLILGAALLCSACEQRTDTGEVDANAVVEKNSAKLKALEGIPDLSPRETVISEMKKSPANVDLRCLKTYEAPVTKKDLMPLRTDLAMKKLDASGLNLSDADIEPISDLKLEKLTLADNVVADLHALARMQTLTLLEVNNTKVDSRGMAIISTLSNLRELNLSETQLRDNDLPLLSKLKHLRIVGLNNCRNLTPLALKRLKTSMPGVTVVYGIESQQKEGYGYDVLEKAQAQFDDDKDYAGVDKILEVTLRRWEAEDNPDWNNILKAYNLRIKCQHLMGHTAQRSSLIAKALNICSKHFPGSRELAELQVSYATSLEEEHKYDPALYYCNQADAYFRKHCVNLTRCGVYWDNLRCMARLQENMKQLPQALATAQRALRLCKSTKEDFPERTASSLYDVGRFYFLQGDYKTARRYLKESVDVAHTEKELDQKGYKVLIGLLSLVESKINAGK